MRTTTINVNQDKAGFYHSCDKETYRKLKRVRYYRHWARIQESRHERWSRKLPHNRLRLVKTGEVDHAGRSIKVKVAWPEPQRCPINLTPLYNDYLTAKQGHERPESVKPLSLPTEVAEEMLSQCEIWLKEVLG